MHYVLPLIFAFIGSVCSQIYDIDNKPKPISDYAKALKPIENFTTNSTQHYQKIELSLNQSAQFITNSANSPYHTAPLIEIFDKRTSMEQQLNYTLTYKTCPNCLTYDFFNNKTSNSEDISCSYEISEIGYKLSRKALETIGSKVLQLDNYNINLINGQIYLTQFEDFKFTTKLSLNDYVEYKSKADNKSDIHLFNTYDAIGDRQSYLLTYGTDYLYVFALALTDKIDIQIRLTYEVIKVFEAINIPQGDLLNKTIDFGFKPEGNSNVLRLIFGQNDLGIVDIRGQNEDIITSADKYYNMTFGDETVSFGNITHSFNYFREENNTLSIYTYLLLKDKGMICFQNNTIAAIFTHPFLQKLDVLLTPDHFYIGLYISQYDISEFFIELAVDVNNATDYRMNKIYTYDKRFKFTTTDQQGKLTYFAGNSDITVIHRSLPYYTNTIDYRLQVDNINYTMATPLSGVDNLAYLALSALSYIDLFKVVNNSTRNSGLTCKFSSWGDYLVRMSEYNGAGGKLSFDTFEYEVLILYKSVTWIYVVVIICLIVILLGFGICCYRGYRNKNGLTDHKLKLIA
jgi:hypothetical protein